jgi:thiamine-monophosphate kinase
MTQLRPARGASGRESPIPNPLTVDPQSAPNSDPRLPNRLTVADLGEHALIARIRSRVPPDPEWLAFGIGDDAAVAEPVRNALEVITTDALVEGIHFDRAFVPAGAVGHKALAVNLSDLAAMGATPRAALLSLALPSGLGAAEFDSLVDEFLALAARFRVHLVGGNITRSPGPLMVDVTAMGWVKRRRVLSRDAARPGDELYLTGTIGGAAAGLSAMREHARSTTPSLHPPPSDWSSLAARYLRPEPRVRVGTLLGRNRAASACVDLSDGLADAARQIAAASGVGLRLDAAAIPVDPAARGWFESQGTDPLFASLAGGEDYELLFAVPAKSRRRVNAVSRLGRDVPLTRIGVVTKDRAVTIERQGKEQDLPAGFAHFVDR